MYRKKLELSQTNQITRQFTNKTKFIKIKETEFKNPKHEHRVSK